MYCEDLMALSFVRIDHVVLRAIDMPAMLRFYRDILGCAVERTLDAGLVQLRAGDSLIDIVPVDSQLGRGGGSAPGRQGHNVDHVCLLLDPFDEEALRRHFHQHGIELESTATRYGATGFGPSVYLRDPQGNTIELKGRGKE
jgi:glyoxylase I family protein